MKKATRETAAATYQTRRREIEAMIAMLQADLNAHAKEAAQDPRNWGFAGDLELVRTNLKQTMVFLRGARDEELEGNLIDREVAARIA